MEEQWLIINDQVLIEAEAAWHDGGRNGDIYPVYTICNLVDSSSEHISILPKCFSFAQHV